MFFTLSVPPFELYMFDLTYGIVRKYSACEFRYTVYQIKSEINLSS